MFPMFGNRQTLFCTADKQDSTRESIGKENFPGGQFDRGLNAEWGIRNVSNAERGTRNGEFESPAPKFLNFGRLR